MVPQWFNSLKAKDKLYFMTELLSFCLLRLKQIEIDGIDFMEERQKAVSRISRKIKEDEESATSSKFLLKLSR